MAIFDLPGIDQYFYITMDQRLTKSSQKHLKNSHQQSKNKQALNSLKNCEDYIAIIFRHCHSTPKRLQENLNLIQHCHYLQNSLKKLASLIPRVMIPIETHYKFVKQFDQVNESYQSMLKQQRDYKCELDVLEKRLAEAEKRQKQLLQQKNRTKSNKNQFQIKLVQAKKQTQLKLQKLVRQINRDENMINTRKKSLPVIINHSQKYKLAPRNSVLLLGSPSQEERTQRLVEHLKRKY